MDALRPVKSSSFARMDSLLNSEESERRFFAGCCGDLERGSAIPNPARDAFSRPTTRNEKTFQIAVPWRHWEKDFLDTGANMQANCPCGEFLRVLGDNDRKQRPGTDNSSGPRRVVDSMVSRFSYTLDSSLDSVNKVEQAAEQLARTSGLDEDQTFQITMAVREAAINAVLHGNAYDPGKKITASFENNGSSLIIRISDQGNGLDPATLPDPLAPENLLNGSGRGIFLIRSFMDEVHFKLLHPGTELTLIKHLDSTQKSA